MVKEKEIPLTIETFSENEDGRFAIISKNEIKNILRTVYLRNTRAALYYSEGHSFYLTTLLAVTEDGIWIDPPSKPQYIRNILNSDRIVFVSSHNQAKVQFDTDLVLQDTYNGRNALFLSLPPKLLRLQRRDYFRLDAGPKNPLTCVINPIPNQSHSKHEAAIMDISIGGISLVSEETDFDLTPGTTFPRCEITLPSIGNLTATVQVMSAFDVTAKTGKKVRRAGCEFVNPDSRITGLLQRYVTHMQLQETVATSHR